MLNKDRIKHRITASINLDKEDDQPTETMWQRKLRRLEERRGQSSDEWMPDNPSVGLTRRIR